ncbi:MAG: hypothetical protein M1833_005552 [Piccolia ochrophora]|nr:MAG: hypothetical protein M1833_005552 [Piccolia ochrophora]
MSLQAGNITASERALWLLGAEGAQVTVQATDRDSGMMNKGSSGQRGYHAIFPDRQSSASPLSRAGSLEISLVEDTSVSKEKKDEDEDMYLKLRRSQITSLRTMTHLPPYR